MADPYTSRPTEVEKALAHAKDRTLRQPTMALNHAVELDRELSRMGWSEPTTYALHGMATPESNSDKDGAPWRTSTPGQFECLCQALRPSAQSPGQALATKKPTTMSVAKHLHARLIGKLGLPGMLGKRSCPSCISPKSNESFRSPTDCKFILKVPTICWTALRTRL